MDTAARQRNTRIQNIQIDPTTNVIGTALHPPRHPPKSTHAFAEKSENVEKWHEERSLILRNVTYHCANI